MGSLQVGKNERMNDLKESAAQGVGKFTNNRNKTTIVGVGGNNDLENILS